MNKIQSTALVFLLLFGVGTPLRAEHGSIFGAELDHFLYFPHFGNGESIRSELVLVNLGSTAPAIVSFQGKDGELIQADSLVEMTQGLIFLEDGAIDTGDIPHLGEITISTNGAGEAVSGSVIVSSGSLVAGFLRFTLEQGAAGVALRQPARTTSSCRSAARRVESTPAWPSITWASMRSK